MSDKDVREGASPERGHERAGAMTHVPLDLPLDFEAFYLGHQESFHAYAEVHFGSRKAAEDVVHNVFLEILGGWDQLLRTGNVDQGAWAIVRRAVSAQLDKDDRAPAFVINGPIAQTLRSARDKLQIMESASGLYAEIAELPGRQFEVIVLRYILGYPTTKVAWFVGLDERTVDHHIRRGRERLRVKLGLPAEPRRKGTGT
ncbi:RNA polymerase sigma factor [Streptomyces sp. NPDC050421]|uniref:RNA polymerase sigma factor n=1 Tax=unclassified Streptomyces TaxID=2593676 RepID=UPI00378BB08E